MIRCISEKIIGAGSDRNAIAKPRIDICSILASNATIDEFAMLRDKRKREKLVQMTLRHLKTYKAWCELVSQWNKGDYAIFQFPPINNTFLFHRIMDTCKRKEIYTVLIVHDIDALRDASSGGMSSSHAKRVAANERKSLDKANAIVVHNDAMKKRIAELFAIDDSKMVSLDIFDYLLDGNRRSNTVVGKELPILIAGNLSSKKAGYLQQLPHNCNFVLYGAGYAEPNQTNIHYAGSFRIDCPPDYLSASFGLVWDGDSAETCSGTFGSYLRINNPHKASFYLAYGIPIIVWDESALASFVNYHNCGISISSLDALRSAIDSLSIEKYSSIVAGAQRIAKWMSEGHFTIKAIAECMNRIDAESDTASANLTVSDMMR